jgi:integrase
MAIKFLEKELFMTLHKNSENNKSITATNTATTPKKRRGGQRVNTIKAEVKEIENIEPLPKSTIFWIEGIKGFGLRITPNDIKSWVIQYSWEGGMKKATLGRYPKMSLSEARRVFADMKLSIDLGVDPFEEERQRAQREKEDIRVDELLKIYTDHSRKIGKKSCDKECRIIKNGLGDAILKKRISQVTPRDISQAVAKKVESNAPSMAVALLKYTKRLFNFGASLMLLKQANNPCIGLKANVPKNIRYRHLSPKEIYQFWHNIESFPVDRVLILALRFLLCTGARSAEVRMMRWVDLDLLEGLWTMPTSKNGRMHRVYLNSLAMEIIKEARLYTGESEYVFATKRYNGRSQVINNDIKPFKVWTLSQVFRRHFDKLGIYQSFYPHDLRRTAATLIAGLFGRRDFAAMVLNHTTSDVTGIYDHYTYDREKRMAWDALNRTIMIIVRSPNVESVPSFDEIRARIFTPTPNNFGSGITADSFGGHPTMISDH